MTELVTWLTHGLALIAGALGTYGWLRGPAGMLTRFEAQLQADLAHIKSVLTQVTAPPAPPPMPPPATPPTQPAQPQ